MSIMWAMYFSCQCKCHWLDVRRSEIKRAEKVSNSTFAYMSCKNCHVLQVATSPGFAHFYNGLFRSLLFPLGSFLFFCIRLSRKPVAEANCVIIFSSSLL